SLVEVRYRGTPLYLSLKSLPYFHSNPSYLIELGQTTRPLLGVVDIPALFRPTGKGRRPIVLKRAPLPESPVVATLASDTDLGLLGVGRGTEAAAVYARSNHWSLIRLVDGRTGWLAPSDAGKFARLERVLMRNNSSVTYAEAGWRRRLFTAPGGT